MSHTEVRSYNSLAGRTLTWEARESLARETNHTTHQHTSHSATTPTMKMQLFSLGVTTGGVTGAERGPHLAASLQRSIVEPYNFRWNSWAHFVRWRLWVGLHGREMELQSSCTAQHVCNVGNDVNKIQKSWGWSKRESAEDGGCKWVSVCIGVCWCVEDVLNYVACVPWHAAWLLPLSWIPGQVMVGWRMWRGRGSGLWDCRGMWRFGIT